MGSLPVDSSTRSNPAEEVPEERLVDRQESTLTRIEPMKGQSGLVGLAR